MEESPKYTLDYALEQIERIAASTAHLDDVLSELRQMDTAPGDVGSQAKAEALGDVVRCRETTNQQLLAFYFKMVEDLKPKQPDYTELKLKVLDNAIGNLSNLSYSDYANASNSEIIESIRQIFRENFAK